MSLTKKHFEAFAEHIGKDFAFDQGFRYRVRGLVANVCLQFSPRFDRERFYNRIEEYAEKANKK